MVDLLLDVPMEAAVEDAGGVWIKVVGTRDEEEEGTLCYSGRGGRDEEAESWHSATFSQDGLISQDASDVGRSQLAGVPRQRPPEQGRRPCGRFDLVRRRAKLMFGGGELDARKAFFSIGLWA